MHCGQHLERSHGVAHIVHAHHVGTIMYGQHTAAVMLGARRMSTSMLATWPSEVWVTAASDDLRDHPASTA